MGDQQFLFDVGRQSQAQFLGYLSAERDRVAARVAAMASTDEGYRQAVEQLDEILAVPGQVVEELVGHRVAALAAVAEQGGQRGEQDEEVE